MSRNRRNPYSKPDKFTKQAKDEGYAARSVYKLTEIHRRFRLVKQGQRVVDLGCSPGSWSQWAVQILGRNGTLVGVDITETNLSGGTFLHASIYDVTGEQLMEALGGQADVVLSDMAPLTTGDQLGDHVRQIELARQALEISRTILKKGGHFVCKIFDGEDAHAFVMEARSSFAKCKRVKPEAVRQNSREFFLVCQDFEG